MAQKPVDDETAAITNLLQELKGTRAADVAVASVDQNGKVTAAKEGTATITVTFKAADEPAKTMTMTTATACQVGIYLLGKWTTDPNLKQLQFQNRMKLWELTGTHILFQTQHHKKAGAVKAESS